MQATHLPFDGLTEPMCYVSSPIAQLHGLADTFPCWLPQRIVSTKLFGPGAGNVVDACVEFYGNFVWATEFSNVHSSFKFTEPPIVIDGETFCGGPEQYYQMSKAIGTPDEQRVKQLMMHPGISPMEAYAIGNQCKLRKDWEQVKDDVMAKAVRCKFTQHESLKKLLLSTHNYSLVQIKPSDPYWGTGPKSNGRNTLGKILEQLRHELQLESID